MTVWLIMDMQREEFDKFIEKDSRWNLAMHSADGIIFGVGLCFVNFSTILPAFVSLLTDSSILIGMIPFIFAFCCSFPQVFAAYLTEGIKLKKKIVIILGMAERVPWLILAGTTMLFAKNNPAVALLFFFACFAVYSLSAGANVPVWMDFVSKTVQNRWRGRLFGFIGISTGLLSIGAGIIVARVLDRYVYPVNYSICFFTVFVFASLSLVFVALVRERGYPVVKNTATLRDYFEKIMSILRNNSNYRFFLLSNLLISIASSVAAFYTIFALKKFNPEPGIVAAFMTLLVLCQSISTFILGYIGDNRGHVLAVGIAYSGCVLSIFAAFLASSIYFMCLAFVLLGIFYGGSFVSVYNALIEFCQPEDRPMFISMTGFIVGTISSLFSVILGALLQYGLINYRPMFLVFGLVSVCGLVSLFLRVSDPRKKL